jgi:hypothetical protein
MKIPSHQRSCLTILPPASAPRQWTSLAITLVCGMCGMFKNPFTNHTREAASLFERDGPWVW